MFTTPNVATHSADLPCSNVGFHLWISFLFLSHFLLCQWRWRFLLFSHWMLLICLSTASFCSWNCTFVLWLSKCLKTLKLMIWGFTYCSITVCACCAVVLYISPLAFFLKSCPMPMGKIDQTFFSPFTHTNCCLPIAASSVLFGSLPTSNTLFNAVVS